jgi:hypothetical protein
MLFAFDLYNFLCAGNFIYMWRTGFHKFSIRQLMLCSVLCHFYATHRFLHLVLLCQYSVSTPVTQPFSLLHQKTTLGNVFHVSKERKKLIFIRKYRKYIAVGPQHTDPHSVKNPAFTVYFIFYLGVVLQGTLHTVYTQNHVCTATLLSTGTNFPKHMF